MDSETGCIISGERDISHQPREFTENCLLSPSLSPLAYSPSIFFSLHSYSPATSLNFPVSPSPLLPSLSHSLPPSPLTLTLPPYHPALPVLPPIS